MEKYQDLEQTKDLSIESIEVNSSPEAVDIFNKPLVFRYISNPLGLLELGLVGKIRNTLETSNAIYGSRVIEEDVPFRDSLMYLESLLPVFKKDNLEEDVQESIRLFKENNLPLNKEKLIYLIKIINDLRTRTDYFQKNSGNLVEKTTEDTGNFMAEILGDHDLLQIYLGFQKIVLINGVSQPSSNSNHYKAPLHGSFAISLDDIHKSVIAGQGQSHGDHGFELLLNKDLKRDEIVGYVLPYGCSLEETTKRNIDRPISDVLTQYIYDPLEIVPDNKMFSRVYKSSLKGDLKKFLEEKSNELEKQNRISEYHELRFYSEFIKTLTIKQLRDSGCIKDKEIMTWRGIEDVNSLTYGQYYEIRKDRLLARMQKLFIDTTFSKDNIFPEAIEAINNYIKNEYDIDPEQADQIDLSIAICIKRNIPIYDSNGNVVGPARILHKDLE